MKQLWELTGLDSPESVIFDQVNKQLYVSNIAGSPTEKDQNGFISRVSLTGDLLEREWITGLNAPKGMAIFNNTLYVADIDTIVVIDIKTASIKMQITAINSKFLNDLAVDEHGVIFAADTFTNSIYQLTDNKVSVWLQSTELDSPNGLFVDNDHLIVAPWGADGPAALLSVSLTDKSIDEISGKIGNLDGIVKKQEKTYLVTDWVAGKLLQVGNDGQVSTVLDLNQGSADLEYIVETGLILIPMLKDNKLLAYTIEHNIPD